MTLYKFLGTGATAPFSGFRWPAPSEVGEPGDWVAVRGALEPCRTGLHLCRSADLPFWMMQELYTVEVDGPLQEYDDFVLSARARLLERVEPWGPDCATSFTRECLLRVRDQVAGNLRLRGRAEPAELLSECDTPDELLEVAPTLLDGGQGIEPLVGYLLDAARFAAASPSGSRWAARAVTVAFIAATAARAAAEPAQAEAALTSERSWQAEWLTDHVLAAV